jgi:hypothetical protein
MRIHEMELCFPTMNHLTKAKDAALLAPHTPQNIIIFRLRPTAIPVTISADVPEAMQNTISLDLKGKALFEQWTGNSDLKRLTSTKFRTSILRRDEARISKTLDFCVVALQLGLRAVIEI